MKTTDQGTSKPLFNFGSTGTLPQFDFGTAKSTTPVVFDFKAPLFDSPFPGIGPAKESPRAVSAPIPVLTELPSFPQLDIPAFPDIDFPEVQGIKPINIGTLIERSPTPPVGPLTKFPASKKKEKPKERAFEFSSTPPTFGTPPATTFDLESWGEKFLKSYTDVKVKSDISDLDFDDVVPTNLRGYFIAQFQKKTITGVPMPLQSLFSEKEDKIWDLVFKHLSLLDLDYWSLDDMNGNYLPHYHHLCGVSKSMFLKGSNPEIVKELFYRNFGSEGCSIRPRRYPSYLALKKPLMRQFSFPTDFVQAALREISTFMKTGAFLGNPDVQKQQILAHVSLAFGFPELAKQYLRDNPNPKLKFYMQSIQELVRENQIWWLDLCSDQMGDEPFTEGTEQTIGWSLHDPLLHLSITSNSFRCFEKLLDTGATPYLVDPRHKRNALHLASRHTSEPLKYIRKILEWEKAVGYKFKEESIVHAKCSRGYGYGIYLKYNDTKPDDLQDILHQADVELGAHLASFDSLYNNPGKVTINWKDLNIPLTVEKESELQRLPTEMLGLILKNVPPLERNLLSCACRELFHTLRPHSPKPLEFDVMEQKSQIHRLNFLAWPRLEFNTKPPVSITDSKVIGIRTWTSKHNHNRIIIAEELPEIERYSCSYRGIEHMVGLVNFLQVVVENNFGVVHSERVGWLRIHPMHRKNPHQS